MRDVFARNPHVVVPYVRYDSMLREGLHDFSYEAGFLRRRLRGQEQRLRHFAPSLPTARAQPTPDARGDTAQAMADRGNLGGVVRSRCRCWGWWASAEQRAPATARASSGKAFFQRNEQNWSVGAARGSNRRTTWTSRPEPGQIARSARARFLASARVDDRKAELLGLRTNDQTGIQYRHARLDAFR